MLDQPTCQNIGLMGELVVDGAYGFSGEDLPHGDATLYVGIDPHAEVTRILTNQVCERISLLTTEAGRERKREKESLHC